MTTYAACHSLGPPLPEVRAAIDRALDYWGDALVGGWDEWLDQAQRVGDQLGRVALGAAAGQVVVADSTSVNIYKLAAAALDVQADRTSIVVGADEFPTDRYVLEGLAAARGLHIARQVDSTTALVCHSLVDFRTSTIADAAAVTEEAHAAGALMLWDVSHAVGAIPIALDELHADLAVGCTYKWLGAGPGAPAFLYVRRDLQNELRQPIWGWFGQRDQFEMGPAYDPEPDIRRFQAGTPPIIGLAGVEAAIAVIDAVGIDDVRRKSVALTSQFIEAVSLDVASPRAPARRGAHVAVRVGDAEKVRDALAAEGVIVDIRRDLVRFGFHPLAATPEDVASAATALRRAQG